MTPKERAQTLIAELDARGDKNDTGNLRKYRDDLVAHVASHAGDIESMP